MTLSIHSNNHLQENHIYVVLCSICTTFKALPFVTNREKDTCILHISSERRLYIVKRPSSKYYLEDGVFNSNFMVENNVAE